VINTTVNDILSRTFRTYRSFIVHYAFLSPPLRDLGATYTIHLRLIGKPIVDFLFILTELFSLGVMAEVLWENTDWKLAFLKGVGLFQPNFQAEGGVNQQLFLHRWIGQWMPYNSVADSFHIKKLCSRLSSRQVHFLTENSHFAFLSHLRGLQAMYAVHLRLIGKPV